MSLHEKHHRPSTAATANAVGGKTARACDSCLRRRARWYCAADDAFLCQSCDSSVHSANPLARRHDRVRLKTASATALTKEDLVELNGGPTWHRGFKRKARTPRHAKSSTFSKPAPLVPDLELAEQEEEEEEQEQLIYCVPIFDPILSEFCSPPPPAVDDGVANPPVEDAKSATANQWLPGDSCHGHGFAGFDPSDMDLEAFAADVESLLGQGLKDDSCIEDALGLMDAREEDMGHVKVEADVVNAVGGGNFDMEMELSRESLDINFDCGTPAAGEEEQKVDAAAEGNGAKIGLKLDYEAVITAWSCRGCSPWTGGVRPQFNPDECWPDFMVSKISIFVVRVQYYKLMTQISFDMCRGYCGEEELTFKGATKTSGSEAMRRPRTEGARQECRGTARSVGRGSSRRRSGTRSGSSTRRSGHG
ncbi:zinc finger protein CONSTANS-LIKE 16-like [Iris pallida]|uniref:Zinc finger protein CONSTANS-LIKE 16-like n=1 Tax=Iris pallida TaxID=29817 RepID=A0AAX6DHR6_IRIPA|nr:zinc finger protein CONSTANS-LIKE 16-like [Iris pallida]